VTTIRLANTLLLIGLVAPSTAALVVGRNLPPGGRAMTASEIGLARGGLALVVLLLLFGVVLSTSALRQARELRTWNNSALLVAGGLAAVMLTVVEFMFFM
jgi:hypothetical protein